jgi:hypothetical protein
MTSTLERRRLIRSRSAFAAAGAVFAVAVLSTTTALANHDANTVHACVKAQNGSVRVVSTAAECQPSETATEWNKQGPMGPAGPMGPQGLKGDPGAAGPAGATGPALAVPPHVHGAGHVHRVARTASAGGTGGTGRTGRSRRSRRHWRCGLLGARARPRERVVVLRGRGAMR